MLSTCIRRNATKSLGYSPPFQQLVRNKNVYIAHASSTSNVNQGDDHTTCQNSSRPLFALNHQPTPPVLMKDYFIRFNSTYSMPKSNLIDNVAGSQSSTSTTSSSGGNNKFLVEKENKRTFSALSSDLAELIRAEFESVDLNKDGKMDSEELKQLLRKHKPTFSEAEILELTELFYVGNAGKAVPFDRLLEAIDNIIASKDGGAEQNSSHNDHTNTLGVGSCAAEYYYDVNHHQWTKNELDVQLTHVKPETFSDKLAFNAVKLVRLGFDTATGWNGEITRKKVLQRVIFLETIAAVPGMTAAIIRHFKSLRSMERDGGLINMFLEEATNERMHLLTFVGMKDPSYLFRAAVIGSQFTFGTGFLLAYMISPTFCHRFVGYIEEEACATYTKIIEAIENAPEGDGDLSIWRTESAPKIGISYWHLGENGTVLDLMYAVRADEAEHRDVNHEVVSMRPGEVNRRYDPSLRLNEALKTYVRDIMTKMPKTE